MQTTIVMNGPLIYVHHSSGVTENLTGSTDKVKMKRLNEIIKGVLAVEDVTKAVNTLNATAEMSKVHKQLRSQRLLTKK